MKIIIIGAGISGLSTYLHLRKHLPSHHTITIYESHQPSALPSLSTPSPPTPLTVDTLSSSTALVGGGLGISPNGMRILRDLDPALHDTVCAQGFPAEHFVFKGANGWTLGMQKTSDRNVRGEGEKEEVCISSSRHGLWERLRDTVGEGVVVYKKVMSIERDVGRDVVLVRLLDREGNEEVDEADLVIGADGVKSVVRIALFGDDEKFKPKYTGQSGVGGFLNDSIPDFVAKNKAMVFTFGGNGFFGYSSAAPVTSQCVMWWSTFETPTLQTSKNIDPVAIKAEMLERHKHWKDPILHDIVQKAEVQSIYPTWVLDELPHWGEKGIVLVGDAAHAMDPTTGQGASQALEDSKTLALLLAKTLAEVTEEHDAQKEGEAVSVSIKLFHQIRSPRISRIVDRGKKIAGSKANVGVVAEYMMYIFLWLMMKYPSIGKFLSAPDDAEFGG
ncbi:FAD/NAD(P)-binding domain-containing protein [Amniculicola lignicola CBS 123094]|uniref:FAD/NAD(P)-binding domain-containing protein n=1 Tax=Amniculicola lignicola CBS 123094 TaxID=1392246 RepID=A0A6A5VX95_9PLEO|nr:FAD/NAD(P)-binding domain-containing protein [Amniculicola lignicola CBS 123094]